MRRLRSKTGTSFSLLYLIAVAAAWWDYSQHPNTFLADLILVLLTIPFTFVAWLASGGAGWFEVRGNQPEILIPAILCCTILVYWIGAALGWLAGRLRARLR